MFSVVTLVCMFVCGNCFSLNNTAELISTYAKVAHWGTASSPSPPNEGRSNGQLLWTHRADVNIRRGQNLRPKQPVTYYYSMKAPTSKLGYANSEAGLSKGEVVERFNPRPYFDFTFDNPRPNRRPDPPKQNDSPDKTKQPAVVYGTPVDSFQPPQLNVNIANDAYNSPFSSYNPPEIKPDSSKDNLPGPFDFPPNNNQLLPPPPPSSETSVSSSDSSLISSSDQLPPPLPSYEKPNKSEPAPVYGPPLLDTYSPSPSDVYSKPKPSKDTEKPDDLFHPPLISPSPSDDSNVLKRPGGSFYLPPPNNDEGARPPENSHSNDEMVNENDSSSTDSGGKDNSDHAHASNYGPPITPTVKPPDDDNAHYLDHPPTNDDFHRPQTPPSMAEQDLSPPPPDAAYGKIPQYLDHEPNDHDFYNFGQHHHYHDVYHEVHHPTTTTTTEAPRAGHYSYYYLGRKLWYIPLYFSVYFIVYVTWLILKSIARHKIQFSHNFDKGRNSRELDINAVNQTVVNAINNVEQKYMM